MNHRYLLITIFTLGLLSIMGSIFAWPNGISGYSGASSSGGSSCGSCHIISSIETTKNFQLQHNIPSSGFIPNTKYEFSLKINSQNARAGFNIKIENSSGLVSGVSKNSDSLSRIEEGELVHTYYSNINNGVGIFNFSWVSPDVLDTLKVHAAVATLPGDGSIDTLNFINYTLLPDVTTLENDKTLKYSYFQYHIVGNERLEVTFTLKNSEKIKISLFDINGSLKREINLGNIPSGEFTYTLNTSGLGAGIYYLKMFNYTGSMGAAKKIILK